MSLLRSQHTEDPVDLSFLLEDQFEIHYLKVLLHCSECREKSQISVPANLSYMCCLIFKLAKAKADNHVLFNVC